MDSILCWHGCSAALSPRVASTGEKQSPFESEVVDGQRRLRGVHENDCGEQTGLLPVLQPFEGSEGPGRRLTIVVRLVSCIGSLDQ